MAEEQKLLELLDGLQLEHYYEKITCKLHVTRIDHFEHVHENDLLSLDMTMPEIRRLLDGLKKFKRRNIFSKIRVRNFIITFYIYLISRFTMILLQNSNLLLRVSAIKKKLKL